MVIISPFHLSVIVFYHWKSVCRMKYTRITITMIKKTVNILIEKQLSQVIIKGKKREYTENEK